jgi:uncharacterized protein
MKVIIISLTEKCNARCSYCEVIKRKPPLVMPLELVEDIIKKTNDYLELNAEEEIQMIWYGGEILLLGVEYFRDILSSIDLNCPRTRSRIRHVFQTNLTLINQEYLDIFKKIGICSIGTSYEPLANIRRLEKDDSSASYNQLFFRGIDLLKKNDFEWDFVYVVTKPALQEPLKLFYHLTNMNAKFVFHPVLLPPREDDQMSISGAEYGKFLGDVFGVWWEKKDRYPQVEMFNRMIKKFDDYKKNMVGNLFGECSTSGNCAFDWAFINPQGDSSQCGKADLYGCWSYGNIGSSSLSEIMNNQKRRQFIDRRDELVRTECRNCRFWNICQGGCPMESFLKTKEISHKTFLCAATKIFFEDYFEPVTGLRI